MGTWGDSIVDLVIPVLIMSVLIFDMTLTTFVRIHSREVRSVGQWLHYTGCDHFHHRLTGLGIGPRTAAWLFFSVSVSFGLEAVALLFSNVAVSLLIITHSIIAFIIIGVILVQKNGNARADARTAAGGMATD
jgi:UDP-GlcNAc:undecaprenyl-phosphate GlcNAc-1-phosphate transferase